MYWEYVYVGVHALVYVLWVDVSCEELSGNIKGAGICVCGDTWDELYGVS